MYAWAGKPRTIRTGKGANWFCYPEFVEREALRVFGELAENDHFVRAPDPVFAEGVAHFLAELNAVHPFREGNGRTQMAFLVLLVRDAGRLFDETRLDPPAMLGAMIKSFSGDEMPLRRILVDLVG